MEEPLLTTPDNTDELMTTTSSGRRGGEVTTINLGRQGRLLQAIFGVLGIGILVPWNAFISAKSYFVSRFCHEEGDLVDVHIESNFSLVYNLSAIAWLGSIIIVQYLRDQGKVEEQVDAAAASSPPSPRPSTNPEAEGESERSKKEESHSFWLVMVPLGAYFAVFLGQSVMVLWTDISVVTFQRLTLLSMGLCGMCGATATAGIMATAGLFPSHISTGPFLAGQSFGGVGVSLANLIAATLEDPDEYWNAYCNVDNSTMLENDNPETCIPYRSTDLAVLGYFFAGSVVLFCSLCGYVYIDHYQRQSHRNEYETVDDLPELALTVDQSPRVGLEMNETHISIESPNVVHRHHPSPPLKSMSLDGYNTSPLEAFTSDPLAAPTSNTLSHAEDSQESSNNETNNETAAVFAKVRSPALCIYLVFTVTLALFPGWISELNSVNRCVSRSRLDNDLYTPFAFVLFNVGDLGGRLLSGLVPLARIRNLSDKLVSGALLRFLLFPLLSLCVGGSVSGARLEIPSNLYSFLIQMIFATSNGFLVTLAFIYAPTVLPSITHVQERSSELLNFCLSLGLLSGSALSFPVSQFLR